MPPFTREVKYISFISFFTLVLLQRTANMASEERHAAWSVYRKAAVVGVSAMCLSAKRKQEVWETDAEKQPLFISSAHEHLLINMAEGCQ